MASDNSIFRLCRVLTTDDKMGGQRIKVRLPGVDDDIKNDNELPWCFPMLPKMIHIVPKVHECVFVFLQAQDEFKGNRLYLGPIISQDYDINEDEFTTATKFFVGHEDGMANILPDPSQNSLNDGTLPEKYDLAIKGRGNNDVIFTDDEIRIRCGQKVSGNPRKENLNYNREDLGYIQMKYKSKPQKDENNKEYRSSINVVADRINLLSHDSLTNFYATDSNGKSKTLTDAKDLISDDLMKKILKDAHPMIFGDELVEFLKTLVRIIQTHTHPFAMIPPRFSPNDSEFLTSSGKTLKDMLSQSIKFN